MAKHYTEEFKRDAVRLLVSSGRRLSHVSRELGVTANTLRDWKKKALLGGNGGRIRAEGEDLAAMDPEQMAEQIRELRRENEYLRRQREILKKAASILAEDPQPGMR